MLLSPPSNTIILNNELMIVSKDDVDNSENASSEKVTSRLSNHFYMVITLAKCVLSILKVNWSQRFRDKRIKLKACPQNCKTRDFTPSKGREGQMKCTNDKYARAKRAKLTFSIVQFGNL